MMISSYDDTHVDKIFHQIETLDPGLTKQWGKVFNYIGMTFNYRVYRKIKISMDGFIKELLAECAHILGVSPTPGKPTLFQVGDMGDTNPFSPTLCVNLSIPL